MRKTLAVLLLFGLAATAQETIQLTPVPPKPTCTPFLTNGSCADLWRNYNQAFAQRQREEIQMYVNRQKQLASESATAPLQQQISDLNNLIADQQAQIKKLQEQMQGDAATLLATKQIDATAALEGKNAAKRDGLWKGVPIGAGGMLLLFVAIFVIRRLSRNFTVVKKSQAASA